MGESISKQKKIEREKIANEIRLYLNKGGKIKILNSQEFSSIKQVDWSGKEFLKKRTK